MTFPLSGLERLYGLVLLAYPRAFRERYENEMRLVFRDLVRDPQISRAQIAGLMVQDLANGLLSPERLPDRALVRRSFLYGLVILAFSIVSVTLHPGAIVGVSMIPVPFIAFIPAGFWGGRHTGTIAGGVWVGLIMGAVAGTMVFWEWLLFGSFPFYTALDFTLSMLMGAAFCMVPAAVGAIAGSATAARSRGESASGA